MTFMPAGRSVGGVRAGRPRSVSHAPGLRRRPPAMSAALAQVEPQAAQAQPARSPALSTARKARKKSQYITAVSTTVIKFRNFKKKKKRSKSKAISPIIKKQREQDENLQKSCGFGYIVLPRCQRCNNFHCFLILFCILLFSQGIIFGLVDLSIDTLHRGALLKTTESMLLSLSYDISSCLVVVFISYYGGRGNTIRWIVVSSFLIGFGSLLFAFPYYSGENYQLNIETEDICKETKVVRACQKPLSFPSKYASFFLLGQIVQGIAGMPLYTLGVSFLDDSVAAHSTGIYIGLLEASVTIGYALGYAIGAPLIKTAERSTSDKIDNVNNEHWLQTWWIRFVFVSIIAWSTSIPLSCFPQHIQGTTKIKTGKPKKLPFLDKKNKDQESGTSIKDLFASVWILIKAPIFVCLALSRASDYLFIIGASEVLPKYIEHQFILSPNQATTLSGLVIIPGAALGQLLGGAIVSKLHMYCKGFMRFIMVTSAISLVLVVFAIFVHCNPIRFAGINEDYGGTGKFGNLTAPCNSPCRCSKFYSPVCGRDDIGYFSPCFAGCTYSKTLNNHKAYFNCSCITEGLTTSDDQGDFIDARPGTCDTKCYKLPLFIAVVFSMVIFATFSSIPNILTILRVVSDKQRYLALGVTFVILRVFGSIPGPVVFKIVVESTCTFWEKGSCGNTGNCWIYNKTKMASLSLGICFTCKVFTIFFTAIAFGLYKCLLKENSDILSLPVKILKFKKKEEKERTDL
ncbi:solute carrier organic anion transporter family member 6A1 [Pteronotus mesoamericanus]|uniref:solute carrier organic anion transporter family member 6A1 n=1 Tax=Pteronotus mesoamericanus TaxID=1884717 RepID=UPI0023EB3A1A|nr:solute carrier organic anion transporter family member 6A1 [Pteronotus parnellii mesoamericanus]